MAEPTINDGIFIAGSASVSAGAMAAGAGARADATVGAVDHTSAGNTAPGAADRGTEIAALLHQVGHLVEAIRTAAPQLEDGDGIVATAELVEVELHKQRPNRHTVMSLLAGIGTGISTIGNLAAAVTAIQHAVAALY